MSDNLSAPDPLVFVREAVDDIGAYRALWRNRDRSPAPAKAAAVAMLERIDSVLDRLLGIRVDLVREVSEFDQR